MQNKQINLQSIDHCNDNKIIILDRDGVLNKLLINPISKLTDSPMSLDEIQVFPWVPECLKSLNDLGFKLAIATNQPSFAKGKNTLQRLNCIHEKIVQQCTSKGATIDISQICFHKSEDNCNCRKPKTGMLEFILKKTRSNILNSWMVGDRATDIIAGDYLGLRTAWVGVTIAADKQSLHALKIKPFYQGKSLQDFTLFLNNKFHDNIKR
jgi:D-glycero-D-manno-heptose 1,7-bisphosphate phosphatase